MSIRDFFGPLSPASPPPRKGRLSLSLPKKRRLNSPSDDEVNDCPALDTHRSQQDNGVKIEAEDQGQGPSHLITGGARVQGLEEGKRHYGADSLSKESQHSENAVIVLSDDDGEALANSSQRVEGEADDALPPTQPSSLDGTNDEKCEIPQQSSRRLDTNIVDSFAASTSACSSDQAVAETSGVFSVCFVCNQTLSEMTLLDQERHRNDCLDRMEEVSNQPPERFCCPICTLDLGSMSESLRTIHVNECVESSEAAQERDREALMKSVTRTSREQGPASAAVPCKPAIVRAKSEPPVFDSDSLAPSSSVQSSITDKTYACKICGQAVHSLDLEVRIQHVKRCGQKFGIRPSDLEEGDQPDGMLNIEEEDDTFVEDFDVINEEGQNGDEDRGALGEAQSEQAEPKKGQAPFSLSTMGASLYRWFVPKNASGDPQGLRKEEKSQINFGEQGSDKSTHSTEGSRPASLQRAASAPPTSDDKPAVCPLFKRIQGTSPPAIVDGFRYANKRLSPHYFLSHFHSDHYTGISKAFNHGTIYCSEITARLVHCLLKVDAKYLHPLTMGTPHKIGNYTVTLLTANHCPGAVIFLFKLKTGKKILHTGDFRFQTEMLLHPALRPLVPAELDGRLGAPIDLPRQVLDVIYLDTTYCNPRYTFPVQQTAIDEALRLVKLHEDSGEKTLYLFGTYTIGKEKMFMAVAEHLGCKVMVTPEKHRILSFYGWPADKMGRFTLNGDETNVHVISMFGLSFNKLEEIWTRYEAKYDCVVAFQPTGWTFSRVKKNGELASKRVHLQGKVIIYGIPYSEHSSYNELLDCIELLCPKKIVPTVGCRSEKSVQNQLQTLSKGLRTRNEKPSAPQDMRSFFSTVPSSK